MSLPCQQINTLQRLNNRIKRVERILITISLVVGITTIIAITKHFF